MALKESTKQVITYLQAHADEDLTAKEVAARLGLPVKAVDGAFTSSIVRKNFGERVVVEVEAEDGTTSTVKILKLNDAGLAYDVNATPETK